MMAFQPDVRLSQAPDQLSVDLDGEIAILNLKSKLYFGLADVGAFIWRTLETPTGLTQLKLAVAKEFDVEPDRCADDVDAFLHDLNKAGLLRIEQAAAS